jgi:hypothetical protein
MKRILFLCLCVGLLSSTASAQFSRISVQGNRFVTADGQPIVFRGLAASDPDKLERNGQWKADYFKAANVPIVGDESYGDALTLYCAKRGISYTPWCFDIHWSPTLIKDWNYTPTRQGAFFKQALPRK